jgi:hypothetical protein
MTKEKAPKEAEVTYVTPAGKKTVTVDLPLGHGVGERLINKAEREGCSDIEDVRKQVQALPTE